MNQRKAYVTRHGMKWVVCSLFLLLVQSAAMAQISHSPSDFQLKQEQAAAQQKNEVENIYKHTHLDVRNPGKKEKVSRQKSVRTDKRRLRFNKKGKAVKRRQEI